ncbi:CRIB domain-containing protein RIC6-like [Primulina huaijiensis]|uniref:CRIB domain-containing protein RIC6-like n=1 Tax=Primulina huaijiensis TaxID=1492673 RepID=UPI003CC6DED9
MKGLLKSLKYISQIFEEEKEKEMQIGLPTDVKHVAHIGSDGPSTNDPPSWMKEFKSGSVFQSAPLGPPEDLGEDSEIKCVSQDSRSGRRETNSESRDLPADLPKFSGHISSTDNTNDSPRKKDSSTKSRQSRRNHQFEDPLDNKNNSSSSNTKSSNQHAKESTNSAPHTLRDVPKKSRRKNKSKESVTDSAGGTSSRSRSKATTCDGGVCTNPYMDPSYDTGSTLQKSNSRSSSIRF